ncbi:TonB C-terminal domain-containing protein, partial [bacterium]
SQAVKLSETPPAKTPANTPVTSAPPVKTPANYTPPPSLPQLPPGTKIASTDPVRTEKDVMERIEKMRQASGASSSPATSSTASRTEGDVNSAIDAMRKKLGIQTPPKGQEQPAANGEQKEQPTTRFGESGIESGGNGGGPGRNVMLQMRATSYYNQLWDHIRQFWQLPPGVAGSGLFATVSVTLARDGAVKKSVLEKSSGNAVFDQSALNAIIRAGKMPPIPAEFPDDFIEVGFRFRE